MAKPTLTEQVKALTERVEKIEEMINSPKNPPTALPTPMQVHSGFRSVAYSQRYLGEGEPPHVA
jgi:hypothetical protein